MSTNENHPTKHDESFSDDQQSRIDEPNLEAGEPDDAAIGATPAGVPHARPDENSPGAEDQLEGKGWTQGGHAVK